MLVVIIIVMSIFTNRIISNAYMSMYKKKSPIMESYTYIYESAIDKNIHRADELADKIAHDIFGKYKYNTDVIGNNGHIQRYVRSGRAMLYNAEYIKHLVGEKIPFSKDKNSKAKFFLGSVRIFGEILKNSHTEEEINIECSEFNKILGIVVNDSNHINEYNNNLNDLTLKELKEKFGQRVEEISNREKDEINSKEYIKNERYTITPCNKWKDLLHFGKYTTWCVAQKNGEYAYNSYTNNGICKFYVCTRDDYETVSEKMGPNCPLDDYGLSMIAICVDSEGNLKTCTCRWNHDNGGNDNIMTTKQISDLLGVNFFETFKPRDPVDTFKKLKYDKYDPLCSYFGFRYDNKINYYKLDENNKIKEYYCCYNRPNLVCLVNTKFEWYDLEAGKEIDPPKHIDGDFNCIFCRKLKTLEGSPFEVEGHFDCSNCNNLTSLEGAPNKVGGDFCCAKCNNLTSLKGAPSEVDGGFSCSNCNNLISLEGAPNKVGGGFYCYECHNLTSLKGAPSEVRGEIFDCSGCSNLPSLDWAPSKVGGDFYCCRCNNITSLNGVPNKVCGDFSCHSCNKLISLKGSPFEVEGHFDCSNCNNLTSLEGAPHKVGGLFQCSKCNNLTSLKGAPSEVGVFLCCNKCPNLTSIDEAPASIRDKIDLS